MFQLLFLSCLTLTSYHLIGKSLFTMLLDVSDTRWTVRTEQEGENLSDEIEISLTLCHILAAFSTGMKTMLVDTGPDFVP